MLELSLSFEMLVEMPLLILILTALGVGLRRECPGLTAVGGLSLLHTLGPSFWADRSAR